MSDFTADEVRVLKALASGLLTASGGKPASNGGSGGGEELGDSFLDAQPWTDRIIKKDPKRWSGESQVGRRYSDAPAEWHDAMASLCDWKAAKGREETPIKCNDKGKPWHEVDAFEARICRAWARRIRARGPQVSLETAMAATTPAEEGATDQDIPF